MWSGKFSLLRSQKESSEEGESHKSSNPILFGETLKKKCEEEVRRGVGDRLVFADEGLKK
jgi:hypothetical protein